MNIRLLSWICGVGLLVNVLGCSSDPSSAPSGNHPTTALASGGSTATAADANHSVASGTGGTASAGTSTSIAQGPIFTGSGGAPAGGSSAFFASTGGGGGAASFAAAPAVSNAGDQYQNVGTNPFVYTAYDPQSTFAADVDSASYDIFRRDIGLNLLPQPDSVRLEEYVNSFQYDYAAPAYDAEVPFSISLAAGPSFFERDTVTLRVGIQGKLAPPKEKKPANLVFLIDTSGSMQTADKLPLVKEVLSHSLDVLEASDTVAIVTYAGATRVALESTLVAQKSTILAALNGLEAAGSTAGAAGLDLAYEQASAHFIEGGINHVVLCTDGDFNVGPSSNEELVASIIEKRKTGITLTALGFGSGNLNDAMMEQVSNAGNGVYSVITDVAHADQYAEESLLSSLTYIAQDMKIQVEFNPERVVAYRLLGYEDRAIADTQFRNDAVDAGEVGSGHRVTALYELVLTGDVPVVEGAPQATDGAAYVGVLEVDPSDLVMVKVRYKDVGASAADLAHEVNASLNPDEVATRAADLDADFQWAVSVATFAEILKGSPYVSKDVLPSIQTAIGGAAHQAHADRVEFTQLFETAMPMMMAP